MERLAASRYREIVKRLKRLGFEFDRQASGVPRTIHDIADHLPEQVTFDDAMYALYVRQKLEEGLSDLDEGRTYTQEEVEQHLLGKRSL